MIAFERDAVHVMNADGSGKRRLTRPGVMTFAWSP
jgi:hypothetical protein